MRLMSKVGASIATAAILGTLFAGNAFASDPNGCTITGNGWKSHNWCRISKRSVNITHQTNSTTIVNDVDAVVNTGGVKVKGNTTDEGTVNTSTGDGTLKIKIVNSTWSVNR